MYLYSVHSGSNVCPNCFVTLIRSLGLNHTRTCESINVLVTHFSVTLEYFYSEKLCYNILFNKTLARIDRYFDILQGKFSYAR